MNFLVQITAICYKKVPLNESSDTISFEGETISTSFSSDSDAELSFKEDRSSAQSSSESPSLSDDSGSDVSFDTAQDFINKIQSWPKHIRTDAHTKEVFVGFLHQRFDSGVLLCEDRRNGQSEESIYFKHEEGTQWLRISLKDVDPVALYGLCQQHSISDLNVLDVCNELVTLGNEESPFFDPVDSSVGQALDSEFSESFSEDSDRMTPELVSEDQKSASSPSVGSVDPSVGQVLDSEFSESFSEDSDRMTPELASEDHKSDASPSVEQVSSPPESDKSELENEQIWEELKTFPTHRRESCHDKQSFKILLEDVLPKTGGKLLVRDVRQKQGALKLYFRLPGMGHPSMISVNTLSDFVKNYTEDVACLPVIIHGDLLEAPQSKSQLLEEHFLDLDNPELIDVLKEKCPIYHYVLYKENGHYGVYFKGLPQFFGENIHSPIKELPVHLRFEDKTKEWISNSIGGGYALVRDCRIGKDSTKCYLYFNSPRGLSQVDVLDFVKNRSKIQEVLNTKAPIELPYMEQVCNGLSRTSSFIATRDERLDSVRSIQDEADLDEILEYDRFRVTVEELNSFLKKTKYRSFADALFSSKSFKKMTASLSEFNSISEFELFQDFFQQNLSEILIYLNKINTFLDRDQVESIDKLSKGHTRPLLLAFHTDKITNLFAKEIPESLSLLVRNLNSITGVLTEFTKEDARGKRIYTYVPFAPRAGRGMGRGRWGASAGASSRAQGPRRQAPTENGRASSRAQGPRRQAPSESGSGSSRAQGPRRQAPSESGSGSSGETRFVSTHINREVFLKNKEVFLKYKGPIESFCKSEKRGLKKNKHYFYKVKQVAGKTVIDYIDLSKAMRRTSYERDSVVRLIWEESEFNKLLAKDIKASNYLVYSEVSGELLFYQKGICQNKRITSLKDFLQGIDRYNPQEAVVFV
ncbi:hypothetical protein DID77_02205 [Candidatus Marinamargulisbacteria bacterium SCGC AG-439-L15]|nr:hypothetical protein DID77_02205 [Candidatus Marinamargulisbacteria bacterium SCGC AG-439-L15]